MGTNVFIRSSICLTPFNNVCDNICGDHDDNHDDSYDNDVDAHNDVHHDIHYVRNMNNDVLVDDRLKLELGSHSPSIQ